MTISSNLVVRTVNKKTMIINAQSGKVTIVDEIGTLFWKIVSGDNKEEIFADILSQYDVSMEKLSKDYDVFINKMKELGLIW